MGFDPHRPDDCMNHAQAVALFPSIDATFPGIAKLGSWPTISINNAFADLHGIDGHYHDGADRVTLRSSADALTVIHEVGHWIYEKILDRELARLSRPSRSSKILESHWKALKWLDSAAADGMLQLYESVRSTPVHRNLDLWLTEHKDDLLYHGSFLILSESWANAFAQTVALESGCAEAHDCLDKTLASAVDELKGGLPLSLSETRGYWPKGEFAAADLSARVHGVIQSA